MSKQEDKDDGRGRNQILLVWPSGLLDQADGFVVGWSGDETWPARMLVVADIVRINNEKTIAQEYEDLQGQLALLEEKMRRGEFCSCEREAGSQSVGQGMKVVANFSNKEIGTSKDWREKMNLPKLHSRNGYPEWEKEKAAEGPAQDTEILFYDPRKVYRHDRSGPESTFGSILEQATIASSLMCLLQSPTPDYATGSEPPQSDNEAVRDDSQHSQTVGLLKLFEKHSLLAYYFSSLNRRHQPNTTLYWTPGAHLWHADLRFQRRNGSADRCFHCHRTRLQAKSPQEEVTNQWISDLADLAVGLLLGLLVVGWWGELASRASFYVEQPFLPQWLDWLESFPIGFKLNVSLTHAIGKEIRSMVVLRQNVLSYLEDTGWSCWSLLQHYLPPATLMVPATTTLLGGSGCVALLSDVIQLLTLHLTLLSLGFRYVYSTELYLLGTSWRLFRGKKQNVLRHRTDTMEYDSMQLLLGSILFVMTLFLLTTVLVYYAFFTLLNLVVGTGTTVALWFAFVILQDFPFGTCYFRLRNPSVFTSQVLINEKKMEQGPTTSADRIIITTLEPIPTSLGSILKANPTLSQRAQCFSSWLGTQFSDILSGRPASKSIVECLAFSS